MTAFEGIAFMALGVVLTILIQVVYAALRPMITQRRMRGAIEYRTLAVALEKAHPGHPGCICFPKRDRDARCCARRHR